MNHRHHHRQPCDNGRRGAAAVEFALVAPLFLLLLAGIIEFGMAFRIQHALSSAARQGARAAVTKGATTAQVSDKVKSHCVQTMGVAASDVGITITVNGQSISDLSLAEEGDEICVAVSIPYSKAGVGFLSGTFKNSTLSSRCIYERE